MYEFADYGQLVHQVRANSSFNIEYLGLLLQTAIVNIGDELKRNDYFDKAPVLEYFRHVRNGLGHGNTFHFRNGEPVRLAALKSQILSADLHGRKIFFEFIGPGDTLDLLDRVESHLRTLTLP